MRFAERVRADFDAEVRRVAHDLSMDPHHVIAMATDLLRAVPKNVENGWADYVEPSRASGKRTHD